MEIPSDAKYIDHPVLNYNGTFSHVEPSNYEKRDKVLFRNDSILLPVRLFSQYNRKESLVAFQLIREDGNVTYLPDDYQNLQGCYLIGGVRGSKENHKWLVIDYYFGYFLRELLDKIYRSKDIVVVCFSLQSMWTILNKYISNYRRVVAVIPRDPYFCFDCCYFWRETLLDRYFNNRKELQHNLKCPKCKMSNTMIPDAISVMMTLKSEVSKWITPGISLYDHKCISEESARESLQAFIVDKLK